MACGSKCKLEFRGQVFALILLLLFNSWRSEIAATDIFSTILRSEDYVYLQILFSEMNRDSGENRKLFHCSLIFLWNRWRELPEKFVSACSNQKSLFLERSESAKRVPSNHVESSESNGKSGRQTEFWYIRYKRSRERNSFPGERLLKAFRDEFLGVCALPIWWTILSGMNKKGGWKKSRQRKITALSGWALIHNFWGTDIAPHPTITSSYIAQNAI